MVSTIASLASGPAASRAGSPGTTCEITNVMQRSPNSIRPRRASRRATYCFRARPTLLGRDRQRVEVHFAGEANRTEGEPLHVVPHAPPAVGQHPEDLRRSEEHTSELQSPCNLVCRLLLEKKKKKYNNQNVDSI